MNGALSDTQAEMVRELAGRIRSENNAGTADPIYCVQQKRLQWGMDPCSGEGTVEWLNHGGDYETATPEEHARLERLFSDGDDAPSGWVRCAYIEVWEDVNPFLTREGADRYIASNRHNLNEPRVYVNPACCNPEWKFLRELVLVLDARLPE